MDMVAVLACVTRTAVSYYFWGRHRNLSPSTRDRIKQVSDDIGYRPYTNEAWFEKMGKKILLEKGYEDPYKVRDEIRSTTH